MTSMGKTRVDFMMRGVRRVKQGQANLTSVYADCTQLKTMFALFGIGGRDVKNLEDPSRKQVDKVRKNIRLGIRARPDQKHLVIYVLACHGMQVEGRQNAVIN